MRAIPRSVLYLIPLAGLLISPAHALAQTAPSQELPPAPTPKPADALAGYRPIMPGQRAKWALLSTVRPISLVNSSVSAGWGTAFNSPHEYGPHWDGFAKRYGMSFAGTATGNAMEAGLGALWGEDPRYFRLPEASLGSRVKHVFVMVVKAPRGDARLHPSYARFMAIPASSFLSNTWRADSDATTSEALERTLTGFLKRLAGNTFSEFWPDVKRAVFRKR